MRKRSFAEGIRWARQLLGIFLSKSSFKIVVKGNRHLERPVSVRFEQIVR